MSKITVTQFLWFAKNAEEAVKLYTSLIPGSEMGKVTTFHSESPSGPPGSVKTIEFTLAGIPYRALEAGPLDDFNHAFSIQVNCETQEEIDRLWDALGKGGRHEPCGWLKDKYGLSWQIVPRLLEELAGGPDKAKAKRVTDAMMKMGKIEIAGLKAAAKG